jgi:hypothetical protein
MPFNPHAHWLAGAGNLGLGLAWSGRAGRARRLRRCAMSRIQWLVLVSLLACCGVSLAHGDWPPKHGGQMNDGGETSFELVGRGPSIAFYVEDHGSPVAMQGARGTVTITRGSSISSAEVRFDTGNRLVARLPHKLQTGDRVLVKVTMPNGSIAAGRYVLP